MKDYTSDNPVFEDTLEIFETSDPAHADIVNVPIKQLHQNTLSNRALLRTLTGYTYDSDNECLVNMLPHTYDNGTLTVPDDMGSFSDETLVLASI